MRRPVKCAGSDGLSRGRRRIVAVANTGAAGAASTGGLAAARELGRVPRTAGGRQVRRRGLIPDWSSRRHATAPTTAFAGQSFNGDSGAQVTLTDPSVAGQLTSGLKTIEVYGINAQVVDCTSRALVIPSGWSSATLPGSFQTEASFSSSGTNNDTFCVDRVDPNAGASITVRATDQAGNVMDPRFKIKGHNKHLKVHASQKGKHAVTVDFN